MPIDWLLKDSQYSPDQIELLNRAFKHALDLLGVVDRSDPLCETVARTVVNVSATGLTEPRKIAEAAVALMGIG